ncbi:hypothetical protein [Streptomyces sp. NPDC021020]|uniref:hypothetical protein n=1 Tax=Streptomyces sp. NPDC021020 TaxID=3365109 RepID=UPI00379E3F9A
MAHAKTSHARPPRRVRTSVAAALPAVAAVALLAGGCGESGAGDGCPAARDTASAGLATSHRSTQDPTAAASYWTEERMRSAIPMPMPTNDGGRCGS